MTRQEWDDAWLVKFNLYYRNGRSLERSRERAFYDMNAIYGPRPEESLPGLPWRYRIALSVVAARLRGLPPLEVSPMVQRLIFSAVFGVAAAAPVVSAALADGSITGNEWSGILSAFMVAAYGKFSTSTRLVAPNRVDGQ